MESLLSLVYRLSMREGTACEAMHAKKVGGAASNRARVIVIDTETEVYSQAPKSPV